MMVIPKSWNYISLEDYEVQPRKLNIVFSRYIENVTNINYQLYKGNLEEEKNARK